MHFFGPLDLASFAFFLAAWIFYAVLLEWTRFGADGLNGRIDRYREAWFRRTLAREMRIVDTTLYNSRWSTVVGFTTHYGFLNTTEFDIGGTLTLTESGGTQHVVSFTVPAGGEVFEVVAGDGSGSPGLNLPPNLAGSATFAFVGSPGAIKADGYFQAVQHGVLVIAPTAWGPRNNQ